MTSALFIASCTNPLARQYEYEEQLYLKVDGSASVVVDASLPALVLLRGASFDPSQNGSTDRAAVRRLYESAGCPVDSVSRLWERRRPAIRADSDLGQGPEDADLMPSACLVHVLR